MTQNLGPAVSSKYSVNKYRNERMFPCALRLDIAVASWKERRARTSSPVFWSKGRLASNSSPVNSLTHKPWNAHLMSEHLLSHLK